MAFKKKFKRGWNKFSKFMKKRDYSTAKKALTVALMTRKLLNVEYKIKDYNPGGSVNVTNVGTVVLLNGIATGDLETTRDGNSILLKSILLRYSITRHINNHGETWRVMLVQDRQSNGVAPAVTDILETAHPLSPLNDKNTNRFNILHSRMGTFTSSREDSTTDQFKKLDFHTKYIGADATQSSVGYNGLYILYVGSHATEYPTINYRTRIRYIDN